MTAEVIVLNRNGVAMAADSVIATQEHRHPVIFNSVDKIFPLSPPNAIGVMVYQTPEFMGVPWETIVSDYTKRHADHVHKTIQDCADHFLSVLQDFQPTHITPEEALLDFLSLNLDELIEEYLPQSVQGDVQAADVKAALAEIETALQNLPVILREDQRADIAFVWRYRRSIYRAQKRTFRKIATAPLGRTELRLLWQICALLMERDHFSMAYTGLALAGFGSDELLPNAKCYKVQCVMPGRLKVKLEVDRRITHANKAIIIPLAQKDMVHWFLQGVDRQYERYAIDMMQQLSQEIASYAVGQLSEGETADAMQARLMDILDRKFSDIGNLLSEYKRLNFLDPVMEAAKSLPKLELASLADAFVRLTSLRRRMSTDIETVGEPIDVAVISKIDSFVWVRKKGYDDFT